MKADSPTKHRALTNRDQAHKRDTLFVSEFQEAAEMYQHPFQLLSRVGARWQDTGP
jgi:hypothetical protein